MLQLGIGLGCLLLLGDDVETKVTSPFEIAEVLSYPTLRLNPIIEVVRLGTNKEFAFVEDITHLVQMEGSYIERDSYDPLGAGARLMFNESSDLFNYRSHYIRVCVQVHADEMGKYVERFMGVYVPRVPETQIDPQVAVSIDCVDIASLLDNDMRVSFSTQRDELARLAIERAYTASQCPLRFVVPSIDYKFSDEDGEVWLATDEITWIECINDMLQSTGNIGVYSNRFGTLESRPYYFLNESSPIWDFNYGSGVSINTKVSENFWDIPNRWTGIANQADFIDDLEESSYTLSNIRSGRTSFESTGRWNDRTFNVDVVTRAGLENAVRWRAQLDRQLSLRLSIENTINPLLWIGDVVSINLPDLPVPANSKGIVTSWQFPFDSLTMSIEAEVPV